MKPKSSLLTQRLFIEVVISRHGLSLVVGCLFWGLLLLSTGAAADQTVLDVTLNGQGSVTVEPDGVIEARVTVQIHGKTEGAHGRWYSTRWRIGDGEYTCVDHQNFSGAGIYTTVFNIAAPTDPASYTASFRAFANGNCGSQNSSSYDVADAVIVVTMPPGGLNHIRLEHDGQGLTCMGETVTVTACIDAACTGLYTDEVTLDFSAPAAGWSADPLTFTGGSASISLDWTTAGSVLLDAAATSPSAAADTDCINSGGGNACEMIFAETGILLDGDESDAAGESNIVTQITGKPSSTGYGAATQRVRVVRTDNATGACVPAVGNQTLDATFSYLVPNASEGLDDNSLSVDAASSGTLTAAGVGQAIQLTFDGDGSAPFSFASQDAGRYQLRVAMAIPAVDADGVPTGATVAASDTSNSFVARPLAVYADANGNPRAQDGNGDVFKQAGEAFTLSYRSLRWSAGLDGNSDGLWDSCASSSLNDTGLYARVPAWNLGQPGADLREPAGGNAGSLAHAGGDAAFSAAATSVDKGAISYSEVGIIQLQQGSLNSFLGESVTLCSPYIGRFIPANFALTIIDHGALANSCPTGDFSYAGTRIGYAASPTAIITARNTSGLTTQNYTGTFMKLPPTGINLLDIDSDASQLGADGVYKVRLYWDLRTPRLTDNGDGTLGFVLSGDSFIYDRTDNDRVAPFISDVQLTVQAITDDDGVTATGLPQSFTPTGVEVRYGRMAMQNAQGSELLPLRVPLQVEYYTDTGAAGGFAPNTADSCTTGLTASLTSAKGLVVNDGVNRNTAIYAPAAVAGSYAASDLSDDSLLMVQPPLAAEFNLNLQPPGQGNAGSTVVVVEVPVWLKYVWSGTTMGDPSAKASFGVFSRPGGLIYQREAY